MLPIDLDTGFVNKIFSIQLRSLSTEVRPKRRKNEH